jgi:hypothetical protein
MDGEGWHSEDGRIFAWRTTMFLELGFGAHESAALALMDVCWHALKHLLDAGCPPELAVRILEPLPPAVPLR